MKISISYKDMFYILQNKILAIDFLLFLLKSFRLQSKMSGPIRIRPERVILLEKLKIGRFQTGNAGVEKKWGTGR